MTSVNEWREQYSSLLEKSSIRETKTTTWQTLMVFAAAGSQTFALDASDSSLILNIDAICQEVEINSGKRMEFNRAVSHLFRMVGALVDFMGLPSEKEIKVLRKEGNKPKPSFQLSGRGREIFDVMSRHGIIDRIYAKKQPYFAWLVASYMLTNPQKCWTKKQLQFHQQRGSSYPFLQDHQVTNALQEIKMGLDMGGEIYYHTFSELDPPVKGETNGWRICPPNTDTRLEDDTGLEDSILKSFVWASRSSEEEDLERLVRDTYADDNKANVTLSFSPREFDLMRRASGSVQIFLEKHVREELLPSLEVQTSLRFAGLIADGRAILSEDWGFLPGNAEIPIEDAPKLAASLRERIFMLQSVCEGLEKLG